MSESLKFNIPTENEPGFIGFIDDVMTIAAQRDEMTPQTWLAMKNLLIRVMDKPEAEAREIFRSFSMPQLMATFELLVGAVNAPKV